MSTLEHWILVAFKAADVAALAGALAWFGVYTYLAKWWSTQLGATVVRLVLYLAGQYALVAASLFWHFNRSTSDVAGIIWVAFYAAMAAELAWRVPTWIRLHMRTDGSRSYTALRAFAAEVWRRRGRPLWRETRPEAGNPVPPPSSREDDPDRQ